MSGGQPEGAAKKRFSRSRAPGRAGTPNRMKSDSGRTVSLWMATGDTGVQPELKQDVTADVCVVGAGVAGLTTAYLLGKEGKKVVLLDDGPVCGGETSRTTAHLSYYFDDGLSTGEGLLGTDDLRTAVESHRAAVDRIEQTVKDEKIDCDFFRVDGYLYVSPNGQGQDFLEKELEVAKRIGWKEVKWAERAPLTGYETGRCLRVPKQAQFHPLKYLAALVQRVWNQGGAVHANTHAEKIEGGTKARVTTSGGATVTADAVVVATNSPVNDRVAIHTKQSPWRTYVIGLRIPKGSVTRALFWDTEDPYHYVRTQTVDGADYDVLISGGEDHKVGQANDPDQRYARIEKYTRERFPMAGRLEFHWSGQIMEPIDCVSYTGRNPLDADNVFVHTGDSGMGMTHGTMAGILLTDLIAGRENPWAKLYDPSRVNPKALHTYAKDNLTVAALYKDLVTPGQVSDLSQIAPRTGAVVRRGMAKVAVYRDENDRLHERSAVCTHMGCVVRWNYGEGSWDCPCHGSRFDPYGRPINGPANEPLGPAGPARE